MIPEVAEVPWWTDAWVPLGATLLGGILSLGGSLLAMRAQNRHAQKTRDDAAMCEGAERAYAAFMKLMASYNTATNLKRHIDGMFDLAAESGDQDLEPWAKVMVGVGFDSRIETIDPSDTMFLISAGNAGLINEIHNIQARIASLHASMKTYNKLREQMQNFVLANSDSTDVGEGTRASSYMSARAAEQARLKADQLNNLLGQVMENLEVDCDTSWDVIVRFKDASAEYFGAKYPTFNVEKLASA